jgi:hypothetical protein
MKTKAVTTDLVRYLGSETKREKKQLIIDTALEGMLKKHKTVTVDLVLNEARDTQHPLHKLFEWDDAEAAEKFRKMQAYAMILSSRFTVQLVEQENSHMKVLKSCRVRKLVNSFNGEGFKLRTDALKNSEDRNGIIEKKKASLRSWCQSVVDIEELKPLRETIETQLGE